MALIPAFLLTLIKNSIYFWNWISQSRGSRP